MQQLVARRDDIDHILIETSGLALPKPLVQAFNWPDIKQFCTVDSVITLIDGPAVAAGRFADDEDQVELLRAADENLQELLDDQLGAADLVIVSKDDLLDETQRKRVNSIVAKKVPASVKTVYASQGVTQGMSLDTLLGMGAASEDQIESVHTHHDHHHTHGEHHEHAHDHFDSFVITLGEVDSEKLQVSLQSLLADNNIYRVKGLKGFIAIADKPMRQVLQAVGERMQVHFDRLWESEEARATSLVFIGKDLDKLAITQVLEESLLEVA